jgi:diguanylate cyclase (GGDEF)-like protein
VTSDSQTIARANAEVLLWQARVRIAVAVAAGGLAFALEQAGLLRGNGLALLVIIAGYMSAVAAIGAVVRRTGSAREAMVVLTMAADLAFIFGSTIASASPDHYYRILILSFFVLHLTESCFGRRFAAVGLGAVLGTYGGLLAAMAARGQPLHWPDELWSLGIFTIVSLGFLRQYGGFQRRLEHIVDLFEGAEQGDFNNAYDVDADRTPDAITRVGRAYNRVRLQLASMVLTDPLTGCFNRRGLDQAMAREIARSTRARSELSLLALDLDHFKNINDTYGHIAGDVVLRDLGALLVQTARAGDMVARTGGEEFSILLPDTDPSGAYRAGVRLCDNVRAHSFLINGKRVHVTVSVGVVTMVGGAHDVAAGTNLKERADEALYAAKRGGRDRVRVWNDQLASLENEPAFDSAALPPVTRPIPTT